VILGPRLCYAGLDDRVTCVRASNGHRLWSVDLGDRISRPIAPWPAAAIVNASSQTVEGSILLVVPDDGARIIALDAFDGRRVATFELTASRRFASSALVLGDDRIALARKGYDYHEAAVVLLRLAPAPTPEKPSALPYNDASPVPAGTPGR
jgi:outer membrane protein assembly factor BamB